MRKHEHFLNTLNAKRFSEVAKITHIELNKHILQLLTNYKQEQQVRIEALGDMYDNKDYMFTQNNGNPRHIDGILRKNFKSFLERCGFDNETVKSLHPHSLRDTFASLMIVSGTNIRTVAGLMGHATPTLTMNTYAQFLPSQSGAAVDVFAPMFEKANVGVNETQTVSEIEMLKKIIIAQKSEIAELKNRLAKYEYKEHNYA